ncbi:YetF domain-containing protein [Paludisphaera sp.]|uniref:DUF421 domain-containing protein n=1 Tax=Paludisphaera sp. TaxID=2017432 RepID=UPI00301D2B6B
MKVDWADTFAPQLSLPEVLIRGTVIYFALLGLLRILPKWEAGTGSIASMLFAIMIGDLAADGVKGRAESVTDILLMVSTVATWVTVVDRLSYHSRWFRFLAQDSPTRLIQDGRLLRANLRRETMTEEDLKAQLRRKDVDDIAHVREAYLEPDGSISVVKAEDDQRIGTAGSTSPEEPGETPESDGDAAEAAKGPDERHGDNGRRPGRPDSASTNVEGRSEGPGDDPDDDPDLRDFLAAAERLQARLEWHQEQVARFKEALTRHGVRFKPLAAGRREEGTAEEGSAADTSA